MTLEFRTHRLWHTFNTIHWRVALILVALLLIPIVTGARPWQSNCPQPLQSGNLSGSDPAATAGAAEN